MMDYSKTLRNNNKIYSRTSSQKQNQQYNSDFSLRFVFSGNERYDIGKRHLSIYPDSFLILNKGTQYSTDTDSDIPVQSFSINFDQQFLEDFKEYWAFSDNRLLNKGNYKLKHDQEFDETIYPFSGDIMYNVYHLKQHLDSGMNDELLINEYLHHCLINYFSIYNEEILKKAEKLHFLNTSTKIEILRRLNLAKEYLYSNYNQNISLDDLAEHSCLSVNHLLRTFKQAFNLTPHQFLIQLRLKRAQLLLKSTSYPINEVVNLIGFECPSSFIRLFKTHYNITPLKYRQTA
ncbi:AraC family transcriptional regulator [Mucilaginibacter sabulilitoris]|uniref:AraC family transcriptional regulator n=1 Tax=Mucilaginibacter sabulilitoris TaxID=1173583 RepID=A0ABZ0TWV8_9SPHI|nr:AraC family transcriptional regulator [Mucilaginibacter sabulilitoris]WPU96638.1 AraC family transcriptional regulator [Mucilaginibacter sabulilitoris]